jgi:hypothetical protein
VRESARLSRDHAEVAWEWVAPVVTGTVTGTVGVVGIIATFKSGNRQSDTALKVARQQADAQADIAREERQQSSLEATYRELAVHVQRQRMLANAVRPAPTLRREPEPVPVTASDIEQSTGARGDQRQRRGARDHP